MRWSKRDGTYTRRRSSEDSSMSLYKPDGLLNKTKTLPLISINHYFINWLITMNSICLLYTNRTQQKNEKSRHTFSPKLLRCAAYAVLCCLSYQCRPDFTTNMQTENSAIVKKTYHLQTSSWGTAWRLRQVDADRLHKHLPLLSLFENCLRLVLLAEFSVSFSS